MKHKLIKIYKLFRYKIPHFIRNIWFFRKELYEFRSFNYRYNLDIFRKSLEDLLFTIENYSDEIESHKKKKVEKIKRLIEILEVITTNSCVELSEKMLNKKLICKPMIFEPIENSTNSLLVNNYTVQEEDNNREIYQFSYKLEQSHWNEMCQIILGQGLYEKVNNEEYDGTGMYHWWD